ncbi:hypothetical protein ES708_06124 [subsurface metagenome]
MGAKVTVKFYMPDFDGPARKRMAEAVIAVQKTALETLSGQRSGRTYYVPGTRTTYTASAPGEPPAKATAELSKNIKFSVKSEGKVITGMVGTDKIQGLMTEFGTRNMKPRPWLRISFEAASSKVESILSGKWL